jgi:NitT/TauT family transport system substrate-binding protein
LHDRIVAVASINSLGRVAASAWVDKSGGNWRSVRFVELPMTEGAAAIGQGRVVAAECAMPALQVALDGGSVKFIAMSDAIGSAYLYTVWFTTLDWSRSQPRAARAFARVVADAAAYTNTHHSETAAMVAQASKLNVAVVEKMTRWTAATTVSLPSIQIPLDAAAKYGTIPRSFPADELLDANAIR